VSGAGERVYEKAVRTRAQIGESMFGRRGEVSFGIAGTTASPVYCYVCARAGGDSVGWGCPHNQVDILKDLSTILLSSFSWDHQKF
jgi:hypothetical protein